MSNRIKRDSHYFPESYGDYLRVAQARSLIEAIRILTDTESIDMRYPQANHVNRLTIEEKQILAGALRAFLAE
ncbi:MAG: hypothetical protein ACRD2L_10180 [Terriglobia bacterium]